MKKVLLVLIILIFIVCALLGFQAASKWDLGGKDSGQDLIPVFDLASTQKNYLLIHVNDLTLDDPQLVAVWGFLVYYSQPPQLMFIPLFPSFEDKRSIALFSAFKLDENKSISSRFFDQIEKEYKINTDGYALVDNTSLSHFNRWITNQDIQIIAGTPVNTDEKHVVILNGQTFFQSLCNILSESGAQDLQTTIHWTEILPDHFYSNLSFEAIAYASDWVIRSGMIEQCNVLSNE